MQYKYNGANELVRENNQFTNQTVTCEYDSWGNLRYTMKLARPAGKLFPLTKQDQKNRHSPIDSHIVAGSMIELSSNKTRQQEVPPS